MKIKKLAFLSTIFAILLPTLVVATVVISYTSMLRDYEWH